MKVVISINMKGNIINNKKIENISLFPNSKRYK